jgi:alanine racemase
VIDTVVFDTRKLINGTNALFVALKGDFRNGHDFIRDAYEKGVRTFLICEPIDQHSFPEANFIQVDDTLQALQKLAKYHRGKFDIPVIAITGSYGKTITKEWLAALLSSKYRVAKSPKSYNSQIGVALSLLEINSDSDIAVIEVGISETNEMDRLEAMVAPTIGIFTSFGTAHRSNFSDENEHFNEKMKLFMNTKPTYVQQSIEQTPHNKELVVVAVKDFNELLDYLPYQDGISQSNASLAVACALDLGISKDEIKNSLQELEQVTMRLETFEGVHNSLIINDAYNIDLLALRSSLEYQLSVADGRKRVVLIGTDEDTSEIEQIIKDFQPVQLHVMTDPEEELPTFSNSIVLIKGKRSFKMEKVATRLRLKKHKTFVEIDLNAIKENVLYYRSQVPSSTKLLTMVKASSYGSGIVEIGKFLERIGVDYLGVAYADEGVQLRKEGVRLPILVMNTEEYGFEDCIEYDLEPCIFSTQQLDEFTKRLIYQGVTNYPIHIKLETGMNRLGFTYDELPSMIDLLTAQPEVRIKSVYSHLANSDEIDSAFVDEQVENFNRSIAFIEHSIPYNFDKHILNSEGILNHSSHHYDMVRMGIGMYGYTSSNHHKSQLQPAIKWTSEISQVKTVLPGETIGYGRVGKVNKPTRIGVIPVGYADGFRRSLSNGKGGVYIQGKYCPVIGNVCMDMIMVILDELDVTAGDPVEIVGEHQTIESLSEAMETIPYELLTGISKRVHRVYIED